MKNPVIIHLLYPVVALAITTPLMVLQAATADEQAMNAIMSAAGNVGVFNASKTITLALQTGNTPAVADRNSAALNAALNGPSGVAVQIPSGDYYISYEVFMKRSGVALQGTVGGNGALSTVLHCTKALGKDLHPETMALGNRSPYHGGGGIFTVSASNVHIRNLAIDFNTRTNYHYNDGYNAIYLKGASGCSVRNVNMTNFEIAVSAASTNNCLIDGMYLDSVRGAHFGIFLGEKTTHVKVDHITSVRFMSHDLSLQGCTNNVFQNCILRNAPIGGGAKPVEDGISFRGGFVQTDNNVFKNIMVDDDPNSGNNAILGTSGDHLAATFGNCYYSNVRHNPQHSAYVESDGNYVPFDHLTGTDATTLRSVIHFVGSSNPPPVNSAPIVSAGTDKSALLSSANVVSVALTGSVNDPDGDATTKLWTKVSGPAAAVTFSAPTATATSATFTAIGIYTLRLTANDGHGHVVSDDLLVVISPATQVNVPPVVSAGADKSATLNAANTVTVALTGSVTDADNDVTTKQWTKVSGPAPAVVFSAPAATSTNATFTAAGTYVLRLTANDGHGHVVSDDVQVIIKPSVITSAFVRRINMNGAALTVGGNVWTDYTGALNQGLSIVPVPMLATTQIVPVPAVDANTAAMLNTTIWNSKSFTINQDLPNGNYTVSLWVMENYQSYKRSFDVSLEGVTKATGVGNLALGQWRKYTYSTTVSDGQLNIALTKVLNSPNIMGLEIVSLSGIAALDFDRVLGSWATMYPATR